MFSGSTKRAILVNVSHRYHRPGINPPSIQANIIMHSEILVQTAGNLILWVQARVANSDPTMHRRMHHLTDRSHRCPGAPPSRLIPRDRQRNPAARSDFVHRPAPSRSCGWYLAAPRRLKFPVDREYLVFFLTKQVGRNQTNPTMLVGNVDEFQNVGGFTSGGFSRCQKLPAGLFAIRNRPSATRRKKSAPGWTLAGGEFFRGLGGGARKKKPPAQKQLGEPSNDRAQVSSCVPKPTKPRRRFQLSGHPPRWG